MKWWKNIHISCKLWLQQTLTSFYDALTLDSHLVQYDIFLISWKMLVKSYSEGVSLYYNLIPLG